MLEEFKSGLVEAGFSSLSESGFIPTTWGARPSPSFHPGSSHLFQRVASFLQTWYRDEHADDDLEFSSLSESGFIPTQYTYKGRLSLLFFVLISFREWLHSYL